MWGQCCSVAAGLAACSSLLLGVQTSLAQHRGHFAGAQVSLVVGNNGNFETNAERMLACAIMIVCRFVDAVVIGAMTQLAANLNRSATRHQVRLYMALACLDAQLVKRHRAPAAACGTGSQT